jgi:hypothetical protein
VRVLSLRERFKQICAEVERSAPDLRTECQALVDGRDAAGYTVQRPVVYNTALDEVSTNKLANDHIKLILVGDNPGRREQETGRYLVGPSGKIAEGFFAKHPELGIDFRRNVIIINKTPVHTPRTGDLKQLTQQSEAIRGAVNRSQREMADLLQQFQKTLTVPVWITGYSEMKKNGIFAEYTSRLQEIYADAPELRKQVYLYRHFSMNQFTIELNQRLTADGGSLQDTLQSIGRAHAQAILGW